jgi:hypothetical protein
MTLLSLSARGLVAALPPFHEPLHSSELSGDYWGFEGGSLSWFAKASLGFECGIDFGEDFDKQ